MLIFKLLNPDSLELCVLARNELLPAILLCLSSFLSIPLASVDLLNLLVFLSLQLPSPFQLQLSFAIQELSALCNVFAQIDEMVVLVDLLDKLLGVVKSFGRRWCLH